MSKQEREAVYHYVHARTSRLIDITDATKGGTVVPIQLGSRFFLAGAAHVIVETHSFEVIVKQEAGRNLSDFVARRVDEQADVGLLEVPSGRAKELGLFVREDEMLANLDQKEQWPVVVSGYPGEYLKLVSDSRGYCSAFTFESVTIPISNWPTEALTRRPVAGTDIFVQYDPEDKLRPLSLRFPCWDAADISAKPPSLAGVSGAGIWLLRSVEAPSGLRIPAPLLLGLQVSKKGKWLRATTMLHWLNLVRRHYPELEHEVGKIRRSSL